MLNVFNNRVQQGGWRFRLKAGALAFCFVGMTLLPWFHAMTACEDENHRGCHHETTDSDQHSSSPTVFAETVSSHCWICDSLTALLQHNTPDPFLSLAIILPTSLYFFNEPHAPISISIYPASRSQAPPA